LPTQVGQRLGLAAATPLRMPVRFNAAKKGIPLLDLDAAHFERRGQSADVEILPHRDY